MRVVKTDLLTIPGVGKDMKMHLEALDITCVEDLAGQDPEEIYLRECLMKGPTDRCCLYVYRLAVAFAEDRADTPEKRKWWNYKD